MKSSKIFSRVAAVVAFAMLAIAALTATASTAGVFQAKAAYADSGNGLIVPMYGWDAGWDKIIDAKKANHSIEIIVVINPSNGPGSSSESHWKDIINKLQDNDIKVVGYIYTSYAKRSAGEVKSQVDKYYQWYDVDGVFLDEVSPNALSYYKSLRSYAEAPSGSQEVILNPGAPVPKSYSAAGDAIIVYENSGMPSQITTNGISESKLAALPYGFVPTKSQFGSLTGKLGYLYISPDWMNVASNVKDQANWAD